MKKQVSLILAVMISLSCIFGTTGCDGIKEHIEDTNGPDDYSLNTITDSNIINLDLGAMGLVKETDIFNDGITFKSKKFSGVERILLTNYFLPSDFHFQIAGFYVTGGNFKMLVVNKDEIIAEIEPGDFPECLIRGLTGDLSLIIAGESAEFQFTIDRWNCEQYDITLH